MDVRVAGRVALGFKRHLSVEVSPGVGAFVFSEHGVTTLRGPGIESLVSLLDGTRDFADLLRSRPGALEREQIGALIDQLVAAGLVVAMPQEEPDMDASNRAYWDACGVAQASSQRARADVGCIGVGSHTDREAIVTALRSAGMQVAAADRPAPEVTAGMSVVVCDDYLDPDLSSIDAAHRAAGVPWLLAKPVGKRIWIGPFFQPGTGACWHCLAHRLWGNRRAEECVQATLGRDGPAPLPAVTVPALTAVAANLVALEVSKWVAGLRYPGQQDVLTMDSGELTGRHHAVRARPNCPQCGDGELVSAQALAPVVLRAREKAAHPSGGHRSQAPEVLLERYRHLISPVTGVVKEISRDEGAPQFVNSYRSGPNLAVSAPDLSQLRSGVRQHSGGKGITATEAKAGALAEAIERYCGSCHGDEHSVEASLSSLGERAIHPNDCMLYADRQYTTRREWNALHGPFQHVCEPFDTRAVMDWTPLWSLNQSKHRFLPTAMLYFGTRDRHGRAVSGVGADSNGNAAGSSLEDAVLQGLLELVERDAVALWWYNMTRAPGVDLASFNDPWISELREQYTAIGREVWALDVTSDLDIPVVVAVSRRYGSGADEISLGFGAHPDPAVALRRSLTELNQLLPAVLNTDLTSVDDPDAANWWRNATLDNQPYLVADPSQPERTPENYHYAYHDDLLVDVESIVATLGAKGLDTLVLDQTRPDIGLPVVKVVVPGLRHFWARFGPGRLYDVPVALGRIAEPRSYQNLNPYPLFY